MLVYESCLLTPLAKRQCRECTGTTVPWAKESLIAERHLMISQILLAYTLHLLFTQTFLGLIPDD